MLFEIAIVLVYNNNEVVIVMLNLSVKLYPIRILYLSISEIVLILKQEGVN